MTHLGTLELHTPRLTLRRFTPNDARPMFETWASDPLVTRFLRWEPHPSWEATAELLHEWTESYNDPSFYNWAVCLKDGTLIGSIGLVGSEPDDGWVLDTASLGAHCEPGYAFGRAFWGHGYATEALCAVRDFWFEQVGGDWLACCHALQNPASGRVMQKAGFRYDHNAVYHKYSGVEVPCKVYYLLK